MASLRTHAALCASAFLILACSTQAEPPAADSSAADSSAKASPSAPVAVVDGKEIYDDDLGIRGELIRLEQEAYQSRLKALDEVIADRLIEAEAGRRGVSVDELMKVEVSSKVTDPSDAEVEEFYERNKSRIRAPLEQIRPQVANLMRSLKENELREELVASLRGKSTVNVLISAPKLPVNLSDAPMRGPENAPITIVEFSDFQCPFCKRVQPTLDQLQQQYGDKLRWSFKDLPLVSIHPEAQKAAEAARCAGDQGKFWEYRAAMFEADRITTGMHAETAGKLGLDGAKFQSCLDSNRYQAAVEADSEEAQALGITGTPAFLVNGVLLSGAQPFEAFQKVIDDELSRLD